MADHQDPSHQANPVSANTYHPALHLLGAQNPHGAGGYQEGAHWHREGAPQPVGNMVMQGEMHYPQHTDAPNYDAGHYHPALQPYPQIPQVPYVHMHRDDKVAEPVPAQVHPFAPEVQEDYDGDGAHVPAADPPEAFPGVQPQPAPPADIPLAANALRNLAGRFLNNPGTLINMLRIEPGPGGRLEVWIALELADIHIFRI